MRPRAVSSSRGSRTPQHPNEVNEARTAIARDGSRAATRPATASRSRSARVAASWSRSPFSSLSTPWRAASTARKRLRNPCCSKPFSASVLRMAWCRPAVA